MSHTDLHHREFLPRVLRIGFVAVLASFGGCASNESCVHPRDGGEATVATKGGRRLPNVVFQGIALVRKSGQVMVFSTWDVRLGEALGLTEYEMSIMSELSNDCDTTGCAVGPNGCVTMDECKAGCDQIFYPSTGVPFAYTCCCGHS